MRRRLTSAPRLCIVRGIGRLLQAALGGSDWLLICVRRCSPLRGERRCLLRVRDCSVAGTCYRHSCAASSNIVRPKERL